MATADGTVGHRRISASRTANLYWELFSSRLRTNANYIARHAVFKRDSPRPPQRFQHLRHSPAAVSRSPTQVKWTEQTELRPHRESQSAKV